ncbi:MAG: hypothetical protein HC780_04125 [Leptolyngbyaceae cyanobacterium CSU_1_3]|nr:hypothetical protein [Leptolyngbyaceae cyanobacterium CSU_1_3]
MPEAEGVALNDSYLQFASCALSRGFASTATPIAQRIHAHNHFTQRSDNQRLGARILILTAYWLRVNFPFIYRFTNKLLAQGMGTYWKAGGVSPDSRSSVDLYLSETILPQRIEITGRAIYHYLKAHL